MNRWRWMMCVGGVGVALFFAGAFWMMGGIFGVLFFACVLLFGIGGANS